MGSLLSSLLSALSATSSSGNVLPKVYLQNDGNRIQFPVGPSSFEVDVKQNNSTININSIGELNMIGKTGLAVMSFASMFPAQVYKFCSCTPNEPYSYVNQIDKWRTSGKPCRFIISDTPVNYAVTIEEFKWGERDGTSDVYFTLNFKEYKFLGNAKDTTQYSAITGLKDRPVSAMDVLANVMVYPGDSIGDVIGRSLGQTANLTKANKTSLAAYAAIAKRGGLKSGDVIKLTTNTLKVNGADVSL